MSRKYWLVMGVGLLAGLMISSRFLLRAQGLPGAARSPSNASPREGTADRPEPLREFAGRDERQPDQPASAGTRSAASLQDALLRPFRFPFSRPTSLEQVCTYLKQSLKAPVVLDRAALDRQNVEPGDTVQLELDDVRMKTGLKLLLDQVGLTYRIVAEDNLMIITDREGSEDPADRIWSELRALHRDLHDVQDAVDELRDYLGNEKAEGPRVRKPTVIEERPESADEKRVIVPRKPGETTEKPDATRAPSPDARPAPSRIPPVAPRRPL